MKTFKDIDTFNYFDNNISVLLETATTNEKRIIAIYTLNKAQLNKHFSLIFRYINNVHTSEDENTLAYVFTSFQANDVESYNIRYKDMLNVTCDMLQLENTAYTACIYLAYKIINTFENAKQVLENIIKYAKFTTT
jgi:hypothetical protein